MRHWQRQRRKLDQSFRADQLTLVKARTKLKQNYLLIQNSEHRSSSFRFISRVDKLKIDCLIKL